MSIGAVSYGPETAFAPSGQSPTALRGELQGLSVQVADDPQSALADSAEELTFARDNSKQTKLADRKQRAGQARQEELIARIKRVQESAAAADNEAKTKALRQFKEQGGTVTAKFLQQLAQLGSHPSSDYAFLLNAADRSTDPQEKAWLQQAADELFAAHQSEIQAVLNTLPPVTADWDGALHLSQAYAEISARSHDAPELLAYIVKTFGPEQVHSGIDALFKAFAADLNSATPSRDPTVLNDLAGALGQTKTLHAALTLLDQFAERVSKVLMLPTSNFKSDHLLHNLLELAQNRFIAPLHVHNLYRHEIKTATPEEDVLLAQEFFAQLRALPLELFASLENRAKLIDATERLLDELIDKEDAWIEGGGA